MGPLPLAPGPPADMDFNEYDEQALMYLEILRDRSPLPDNVIELNPYQFKPCHLPGGIWYLAHSTEKEKTEFGFWRQKEAPSEIFTNSGVRCWRTTLEFIEIQDGREQIINWVMQEYKIAEKGPFGGAQKGKESKALCRVFSSGGRSSNVEMHPNTAEAVTLHGNQIHSVASVVPSSETISKQGSTSSFLVNKGGDTKQLVSETDKHLDKIKDISELHYFSDGDYLELDDLVDPQSLSTSSDNSSRSSLDEYFDPDALLQALDNENNQKPQGKDSNSRFSVAASVKPFEVVMQPATLGSLVSASGKQPAAECTLPSSTLKAQNNDERMQDDTDTVKNSRAKKRHEHPSSSSSSSDKLIPRGKEKAAGVKMKTLTKYFCFMQL